MGLLRNFSGSCQNSMAASEEEEEGDEGEVAAAVADWPTATYGNTHSRKIKKNELMLPLSEGRGGEG